MAFPLSLSDEQKAAVKAESHLCLVSCPGSGKTRTIVAKLLRSIEEVRGTARRIGCITYTNAAVHEIEQRVRQFGGAEDGRYYNVETIHTFCLHRILRPFRGEHPRVSQGISLLSPEAEQFRELVAETVNNFGLDHWTREGFAGIRRQPDGRLFVPDGISASAASYFLSRVEDSGHITLDDIVYFSYEICRDLPYVARGLASRFAWLLIDEYQDTSELQAELLKTIASWNRTRFLLVGDPNQSILGFAGANSDLMDEMASHLGASTDVVLSDNWRCSERIVSVAEQLCPLSRPMRAVGDTREYPWDPTHVHRTSIEAAVQGHFLPLLGDHQISLCESAVLAPQWRSLYSLGRTLRRSSVPITGPGSRPYRRSREFAQFAEAVCGFRYERTGEASNQARRSLYYMLLTVTGRRPERLHGYEGKKTLHRLVSAAKTLEQSCESVSEWLMGFAGETAEILMAAELLTEEQAAVVLEYAESMAQSIERDSENSVDALSLETLGLFAVRRDCMQLRTIHGTKGREFEAVAIVDLHDGKLPHFSAEDPASIREARRLLYVATTRAKKLLVYYTDSSRFRNQPSRFLSELLIPRER